MELIIFKENFVKGLHRVQSIVDKKGTMPILSNVMLEAKKNEIFINATDLEVGLKEILPAEVKKEGKITLLGRKLYEIIKELPEKKIYLRLKENFLVEIISGKSVFNLMGMDAEKFPYIPSFEDEEDLVKAENNTLKEMINKTIFAVSNDESRKNLLGVYITQEGKEENKYLRMVATDGYRMSMIDRKIKEEIKGIGKGILVPKKGILELAKILDEDGEELLMKVKNNNLLFKKGKMTLLMRLLDAEFPDYEQVIPTQTRKKIKVNRGELLESLKRVSILSSEKTKGVKFHFQDNYLELTAFNPELGEAKEVVTTEYKGDDLIVGFNARFVLEVLDIFESEHVDINMEDAVNPAILRPVGDHLHKCIIMPMRLN